MAQNLKISQNKENSTDIPLSLPQQRLGLSGMVENFLKEYFSAHQGLTPTSGLYDRIIREVERPLLRLTLKSVACNQKKAAEILGINRNTLRKKISDLNINLCDL